ncbi:carbohydrate ABC transporter permease [Mesorhizobium neociceri]|uniref:carbohydrate ABC transporter permease n=1 Tax=Mesorhizobium neociceri TaxID=1307853 RepID=UPI001F2C2F2D|nr:sugar ABC transporter permease [Mesorhizobium neociceri]
MLFVLPALAVYLVFAVLPLATSIVMSFFQTSGASGDVFVGLANYERLFTHPTISARFWNALLNNMQYFAIHLIVEVPMGLLLAALLTSGKLARSEGIYRTLLFIPATLSVVIVGFVWRLIINPLWGLVGFPLLGTESTALTTISLMSVWQYFGIPMVFLYSALLAVPNELVEAANIDGAGGWTTFWKIKFPLIAPQFGLIAILTYIWTFNGFDLVFALNGSAPGPNYSTDILGTYFYRTFFGSSGQLADLDLGSAVATVIFLTVLLVTAAYFWLIQRRLKSYSV